MGLYDDFKKQICGQNDQDNDTSLPWTMSSNDNEDPAKTLSTKKIASIGLALLITVVLCFAIYNYFSSKNSVSTENNTQTSDETNINSKIQVHVAGEVINPGVYKLDVGSRIIDAVNAAGGFSQKADRDSLNLAKVLDDGEQILINSIEQSADTSNNQSSSNNNGKVNINTADLTQLQTLSGVGPSTAQKIIDYRNANGKFKTIEDVKKVSGIGEKTFEKFKDKICV